jgi:hypothetical protein
MGVVMIKCPTTGRAVSTGIEVDADTFANLPDVSSRLGCSACGTQHSWSKSEAWLAEHGADSAAGPPAV